MRHVVSIKITVVEPSEFLRAGIIACLKNELDCEVVFQEVANVSQVVNIKEFDPDIIITNPMLDKFFDVGNFQQCNSDCKPQPGWASEATMQCQKKSKQVHYIALSVAPVDSSVLAQYEAVINLYDDPVDIHLTIDKLMKFNKNHEVEDGELSEREKEIIRSVVKGKSNKQIAEDLNLSVYTVLTHRRNISKKLQIHSASALTIYAISNKLLNINEVKQL